MPAPQQQPQVVGITWGELAEIARNNPQLMEMPVLMHVEERLHMIGVKQIGVDERGQPDPHDVESKTCGIASGTPYLVAVGEGIRHDTGYTSLLSHMTRSILKPTA